MGDIKYIAPGLSGAIAKVCVDRIIEFASDREDGVAPSGKDTNTPRQEIQEAARHLFQKIQRQYIPFGSLRLFSGDSSQQMNMDSVDDVVLYLRQELGFDVDAKELNVFLKYNSTLGAVAKNIRSPAFRDFATQLHRRYPPSAGWGNRRFSNVYGVFHYPWLRQIVLDDNFGVFAVKLKKAFDADIFWDISKALDMYHTPRQIAFVESEEAADVYKRLGELFDLDSKNPYFLDLLYLEALSQRPDLKEHLESLQTLYKRLHKHYGDGCVVGTIKDVKALAMIAADSGKTEGLLSSHAKQVYNFLVEEIGQKVFILRKKDREELLKLASEPKFLTGLRDLYARFGKDLLMGSCGLSNLLPKLADVASHPSADRIWAIAAKKNTNCMSFLRGLEEIAESPAGLDAVEVLVEHFPGVGFLHGSAHYNEVHALSDPHIASLLSSWYAADLYYPLRPRVRERPLEFFDFLDLLRTPNSLELVLDEVFMEQCREALRLVSEVADVFNYHYEFLKFIKLGPDGVSRLLSPDCREALGILRRWGTLWFFDGDTFLNLMDDEQFLPMLRLIDGMGIVGEGKLFGTDFSISAIVPNRIKNKLEQKDIRDALSRIAAIGCFGDLDLRLLNELLTIAEVPGADQMLGNIKNILGRQIKEEELPQLSTLLNDESLHPLLIDSEFLDFCRHVHNEFLSPQTFVLSNIKELAVVYPRRAIVYNERFKELLNLVRRDFGINCFRPRMLPPLMQLAESLDFERIEVIRQNLGRPLNANDLFLLDAVAHDPALEKFLMDRGALLKEAGEIYRHDALPLRRLRFDNAPYTERPPLEEIDSLSLLRLDLLRRALQDKGVRKEIGDIVSGDLADSSTEYGGTIIWDRGLLHFSIVKSTSHHNGAYSNKLSEFLQGGLMSFHLHATCADDSPYAGPSGDPWGGGDRDWGRARRSGATGVVITTAGLVKGSPEMIRVNLDMYYVDEKGRPFVIDLGVHEVPYTPPKPKPSRKSSSVAKSE